MQVIVEKAVRERIADLELENERLHTVENAADDSRKESMSQVRNAILEECERVVPSRITKMQGVVERGVWAARALEIVAKAPEAEEYVELLKKLDML